MHPMMIKALAEELDKEHRTKWVNGGPFAGGRASRRPAGLYGAGWRAVATLDGGYVLPRHSGRKARECATAATLRRRELAGAAVCSIR